MTQWGSLLSYTEPDFSNGVGGKQETLRRVTAFSCLRPSFSPHTPVPICPLLYSVVLCLAAAFCSGVTYSSSALPERSIVEDANLSPERLLGQPCLLPIGACHSAFTVCFHSVPPACASPQLSQNPPGGTRLQARARGQMCDVEIARAGRKIMDALATSFCFPKWKGNFLTCVHYVRCPRSTAGQAFTLFTINQAVQGSVLTVE